MSEPGRTNLHITFDQAAVDGKCDVMRAMLRLGLDVCGGISGGVKALEHAAGKGHVEVMQLLTDAGVKDTGACFVLAAQLGQRNSIRFLMKQYEKDALDHVEASSGPTLLIAAIKNQRLGPKMVRWLMDAGANTRQSLILRVHPTMGPQVDVGTPKNFLGRGMARYTPGKVPPTLIAIDRLLRQEEAVHAKSWLWPEVDVEVEETGKKSSLTSIHVVRMSRSTTSRVVLGGLLRYTRKKFEIL